jgi:hypothetical protein
MKTKIPLPAPDEYAPFYADYIQRAQARENVLTALPQQIEEIKSTLGHLSDKQARFKPGPAEWSIKEVIGHLNDVERVFSYRLLRISRNDPTPLPGFEQEDYVREAKFDNYTLGDLISEFEFLRRADFIAINNMSDASTLLLGTASGATISSRALIHMLVGHVDHHMASLHEKYLPAIR